MRHFLREKIKKFKLTPKKSVLRFLSLKYSANFSRSRLVFNNMRRTVMLQQLLPECMKRRPVSKKQAVPKCVKNRLEASFACNVCTRDSASGAKMDALDIIEAGILAL